MDQELLYSPSFRNTERWLIGVALAGVVIALIGFILAPLQSAAGLLLVSFYLLGLGLAGVVFAAVQYVSGAGWSVALRRVPEAMAAVLSVGALALLVVLLFFPSLYGWTDPSWQEAEAENSFKIFWLNRPFFLLRAVLYLAVWMLFAFAIVRNSRKQDDDAKVSYTRRNVGLSAGFLVVFAVTCWLASYDWIMSLDPHWYSTIFGVYHFAGLFLSGLAAITGLLILLQRLGPLRTVLTKDHLHDLGKLIFGISTFWAYIWFCQYMLIWYVNIPEETTYYVQRLEGVWLPLFWMNLVLNWLLPFFILLSRKAKRSASVLWKICVVLLVGRWLDLYLMIFPSVDGAAQIGFSTVGLSLAAAVIFIIVFFRALRSAPYYPINDPYLIESVPSAAALAEMRSSIIRESKVGSRQEEVITNA